nr:hypothetical protein [Nocardioides alkalitolerans]
MLSDESRLLAGVLLLSLVTVETGGLYLLRIVRGTAPVTAFQEKFARAGHAHAAVLLLLGLVCLLYVDATSLDGAAGWLARSGVPASALLLPGGFFFSSMGAGRETANPRFFWMVPAGGLLLAISLATLGVALLVA